MLSIVQTINAYLSDYILVFLLVAVGLWYTIKTRFVQVRCFGAGLKKIFGDISFKGGAHGGGMSSFQAVATAIAAQVGTGNIVGAAGAILTGGPGAIFWMWIIAFLGMATIYAEATLAQKFSPKVSILAGDYVLSCAVEKLLSLNECKIMEIFKNIKNNVSTVSVFGKEIFIVNFFARKTLIHKFLVRC